MSASPGAGPGADHKAAQPQPDMLQRAALRRLYRTLFLRGRSARRARVGAAAPRSIGASLWLTLLLYGLMGAFTAPAFSLTSVLGFAASLHGVTFFLVMLYVSASAGEALFHKEEADILMHRPITPQTLLRAKVRVLLEITWWLAGAYNLVGLCLGYLKVPDAGWLFVPSHILSVALEALFCVSFIVMTYELCLRWFGRDRLDSLMTTTQVMLSAVGVLVWNLMPHASRMQGGVTLDLHAWWTLLLPPFWFASLDELLTGNAGAWTPVPAVTGVVMTFTVAGLAFGRLAGSYGEGLVRLNEAASEAMPRGASEAPSQDTAAAAGPSRSRRRLLDMAVHAPPLRWWLRNPQTRASFMLTLAYLLRDREVKLRVYPQLASAFAIAVALKLNTKGGGAVAPVACLLAITPVNALESLRYSQQWQAGAIFRCVPMTGPGPLCDGARRAVLVFLLVPTLMLVGLIALLGHGFPGDLGPAAACLALLPLYARIPSWHGKSIPLSESNEDMRPRRGLFYIALFIISAVVLTAAAFAETRQHLGTFLAVELGTLTLLYILARRRLASITWATLDD